VLNPRRKVVELVLEVLDASQVGELAFKLCDLLLTQLLVVGRHLIC
jgi:hypothetical protein